MTPTTHLEETTKIKFGTVFADKISIAWFKNGRWSPARIQPNGPLPLDPSSHVLHYASSCFEGLKAHGQSDGSVCTFRLDCHMKRLQESARLLCLPVPDTEMVAEMVESLLRECRDWVPEQPGTLYIRPTLFGTLHSIGAAAAPSTEACLFILLSPVGDYFEKGPKPLKIMIETDHMRTSPDFGRAKAGGNYSAALKHIVDARAQYQVDQVLFAPNGDVQETGAANFFLINDNELLTKDLDASFLHGVTRDSIIRLARDMGYKVSQRQFGVEELRKWVVDGEAALSGTAAILAGIGSFIHEGEEFLCGDGNIGPNTLKLRQALVDIQTGKAPDTYGWLKKI